MSDTNIHSVSSTPAASVKTDLKQKQKLQSAVREFESMLVGYMLKSMRSTVVKEDAFGDSYGGDMMEGLFDNELAKHVSSGSNLGIAEMLYFKMTGEHLPKKNMPFELPVQQIQKPTQQPITKIQAKQIHALTNSVSKPETVSLSVNERIKNFDSVIRDAAEKHGVDPNLVRAVIAAESGGKTNAQSNRSAKGLMQLIDSTASAMGVINVWDPKQNIHGGTKYLGKMLDRYKGNVNLATAAYNAGPGAVDKHKGIPPIAETKSYVKKVMNYLQQFEQEALTSNDNK